jgi:CDP-6-deoxy-D-xylo-4-hexulose-3-dehydrase
MTEISISIDQFAKDKIRKKILELVQEYSALEFAPKKFIPGQTAVPPSGKLIDSRELENMVEASLDGWLTTGRFNDIFEKQNKIYLLGNNNYFKSKN